MTRKKAPVTTDRPAGRPTGRTSVRSTKICMPKPPTADLVTLAGMIPAELLQQMAAAIRSERWLFAVWNIQQGQIHLERTAVNFPTADLGPAVQLLKENLQQT